LSSDEKSAFSEIAVFINDQNKLYMLPIRALFLDNTRSMAQRRGKRSHRV
jgi:hypothetical protein